ncbi:MULTISPECIES: hypothetical protein, partial [Brucella]|uniref:hypothetical protein n=1 Tax=Brucella TaxID=234 RepID=UPI001AEC5364
AITSSMTLQHDYAAVNSRPHAKTRHEAAPTETETEEQPTAAHPSGTGRNLKTVDVHVNHARRAISIKINLF